MDFILLVKALVWSSVLLVIYFLPTIIAFYRNHRNVWALAFTNLVFGWTVVGWCATFIWAIINGSDKWQAPARTLAVQRGTPPAPPDLPTGS